MWRVVLAAIVVGVMVFSLVDVITIEPRRVRHLPKAAWAVLVVLTSLLGSLLWWTLGRAPRSAAAPARPPAIGPEDDPSFIDNIEQRRRSREQERRIRDLERRLADLDDDEPKPGQ